MQTHKINAQNKKLGRIASSVAVLLMGKNRTTFVRNKIPIVTVYVENVSKLDIPTEKQNTKMYKSFSGYPGGLKTQSLKKLVEKKGLSEVMKKAIYGMLPHNKLRPQMMKNLIITE